MGGLFATLAQSSMEDSRVLDWSDLVPDGWEPPLIAPAYDQEASLQVDTGSLMQKFDGVLISLPGYMKPIVFEDRRVSEFLLVPYLPQHMKQHSHLEANQRVYVSLQQELQLDNPFQPVWVTGTMTLLTVATDEGPAGYSLSNAVVTPYQIVSNNSER